MERNEKEALDEAMKLMSKAYSILTSVVLDIKDDDGSYEPIPEGDD